MKVLYSQNFIKIISEYNKLQLIASTVHVRQLQHHSIVIRDIEPTLSFHPVHESKDIHI